MSDRCIPCEKVTNWVELDFRDENNQPYEGIEVTIEDAVGTIQTISLKAGPNLIENIASGPIKVSMEPQELIDLVEGRDKRVESESSPVVDFSKEEKGGLKGDVNKVYQQVTLGDLWSKAPDYQFPEEHHKGKLGNLSFVHNESYVIEILDFTKQEIRFGVFFDGTGNNSFNADFGARCEDDDFVPDEIQGVCEDLTSFSKRHRGSYDNSITNIGRLSESYDSEQKNVFSIYMEGVGTKALEEDERFPDMGLGTGDRGVISISQLACEKLASLIIENEINHNLSNIVFDIFGFSRGAATARHFANEIYKKMDGLVYEKLQLNSSSKVSINFIGLYDTVAAIGCIKDLLDTTDENNHGINLYLPKDIANKVVHFTAHHECRDNFSLNSVAPEHQEIALLGVHSDIGGGYKDPIDSVMIMKPYLRTISEGDWHAEQQFNNKAAYKIEEMKQEFLPYVVSTSCFSQNNIVKAILTNKHYRFRATLSMTREISPDLQLLSFNLMHKIAIENKVPLSNNTLNVDDKLTELYSYYEDCYSHSKNISGLAIIKEISESLSSYVLKHYVHCSDHWAIDTGMYTMKPRVNQHDERERQIWSHKKQKGYPF
ncbi:T6SS phospholipase effector Tle1-like catalytic domain-containing protein [Aliivibrio sifiae]|uniref:T6SS Phospholipase effector Tle1-like catalytic domain-containing protein n=1 Tax=Aliivibrio sifiae TaxID=566293 RepID=A0A2S7X4K8_9GAMM|nr:DUF2235 domain-containing protein [Aliivibrio sifiae]PQJ84948.1 hypothetical protein BTO22_15825 [Aliivibrio sifiae]